MKKITDGIIKMAVDKAAELGVFLAERSPEAVRRNWNAMSDILSVAFSAAENETSKRTRFVKPTVDEIKKYCEERANGIDADTFFNFYESKGWKIGNSPMKNWQACVRTWEGNAKAQDGERYGEKDMWIRCEFCKREYFRGDKHECPPVREG